MRSQNAPQGSKVCRYYPLPDHEQHGGALFQSSQAYVYRFAWFNTTRQSRNHNAVLHKAYRISVLARQLHQPTESHRRLLKRLLRNVGSTSRRGIFDPAGKPLTPQALSACVDANWGEPMTRKGLRPGSSSSSTMHLSFGEPNVEQ